MQGINIRVGTRVQDLRSAFIESDTGPPDVLFENGVNVLFEDGEKLEFEN